MTMLSTDLTSTISKPIVGELRDGTPIEKGVVVTEEFLIKNEKLFQDYSAYFMLNPDLFLDLIKTKECPINFYFYQRVMLRAMMRYRYFYGTFTRATSKSFLAIISQYLACMFLPRSKRFVVSQFKKASLSITKQKLEEIWTYWPLLKTEILTQHMSTDYIELIFKNGSTLQILALSASSRGQRASGGLIEEAALIDGDLLAEVIIPMMNIPRQHSSGGTNEEEPHSQQIYITSAGSKNTFAYERLIELTTLAVIEPRDYFICGASYELPLRYGLFDKKTIQDQKMSSTFSSDGFARESMSIWTGGSKDSWFNPNKLIRCRKLLNCERKAAKLRPNEWYMVSIDVARYGENDTSIFVFKVRENDANWHKSIVYIENITKMSLPNQATRIKEINELYHPREIVIDANGIGAGLVDELVLQSLSNKGILYEPLYVKNDPENYPYPRGKEPLVYALKANATMNNEIYSNAYVQINSGNVSMLAPERVVKEKMNTYKSWQKKNFLAREKFLLPYIMTSRLIDEINNLRLKPTGSTNQIAVEQISRRINKDRFSAMCYGLYRIKEYEDKAMRRNKHGSGTKSAIFFSSSKKRRSGE